MNEYATLVVRLKTEIRAARLRASLSANAEMLLLYWQIGQLILTQQAEKGWGAKVIEQLSDELRREFPDMKGLSARNLKYMRRFAEAYPDKAFVQATLAQITWYHHITLLEKVTDPASRLFYVNATREQGWSRDVMVHQIENGYQARLGKSTTNFSRTLPEPQSDLARQSLKDPYLFDFMALTEPYQERDLEKGLVEHIASFLLELGKGFAYVGRQVPLSVGDQDYFLDLLFYHLKLRCYVVVELKVTDFKPEFAGKLNFYLSVVDDQLRHEADGPTIGLLICKSQNSVIAEYALRDINKPIGISEYRLTESLPDNLKSTLPSIDSLEEFLLAEEAKDKDYDG